MTRTSLSASKCKKGNFSFVIGDNKLKKLVLKGKSLSAIKVLPDLVICRSKATI